MPSVRTVNGNGDIHEESVHDGGRRVVPRSENLEADSLANGITDQVASELERRIDLDAIEWEILPPALERYFREAREPGLLPKRNQKQRKKRPEQRLKQQDQW